MSDGTVNHRSDGHLPSGKFAPGNKAAVGNPINRRMYAMRAKLLAAVSGDQIERIAKKLAEQAEAGDTVSAKLLLEYVVGRPPQSVEVSGPDGEPLGLELRQIEGAILAALAPFGDGARFAVAAALRGIAIDAGQRGE